MPLKIFSVIALLLPVVTIAEEPASSLRVEPAEVVLHGHRSSQQLLVSEPQSGGVLADVTREVRFESIAPAIALVTPSGRIVPRGHGTTEVVVRYSGSEVRVPVKVVGYSQSDAVDFQTDVIAAISKAGCNQGACHGSPQGKGGFRLSLRGFDPVLDFSTLTREEFGRRTNPNAADESLILKKGLAEVPHQGGARFKRTDAEFQILRAWIDEGCRPSLAPPVATPPDNNAKKPAASAPTAPKLVRLEVLPGARRLAENRPQQQLIARAHFDNGTVRDVTDLAVFSTNEKEAASVNRDGLVEFSRTAEVPFLVRYLDRITGVRLSYLQRDSEFVFRSPAESNAVDRHVFAKQRDLQLLPAELARDDVFLRRVFLDVTGVLPTPDEARRFLEATDSNKRAKLIDELLARDEYAQLWALKWADLMRGSDVTISRRGVHSFHRYLVERFRADRPFDEFARETLTSLGNTLNKPGANFHRIARAPDEAAEAMAQLFLGVRIGCAKCHNHPFEAITQDDYYGLAAYFARVKFKGKQFMVDDEIIYLDRNGEVRHPTKNVNLAPAALGEPAGELTPDDDRRERLVSWLTRADNPYFARSTANRVWYHLFGRGIVEPVDDFRDTNPPSNPELLDELAREFVSSGYRIKPVLRLILNSSTYQLDARPVAKQSRFAAMADPYFTHAVPRMLTAEQLLDAVCSVTGVPETFPGYPRGTRAIELPEGAIEHSFLKAFAKPVRDVTCECAREDDPSLSQVIHLLNNRDIVGNLKSPQSHISRWLDSGKSDDEVNDLVYLLTLSRHPTASERDLIRAHLAKVADRRVGFHDLQHALLLSNEFLLRH
ncbi:surface protein [Planctomycetia bacterium]|nr:surface protein [Planctomycetia bacterium]